MTTHESTLQAEYYASTARTYDDMHLHEDNEHLFALRIMECMIDFYGIRSILDIGAGTGRVALYLRKAIPNLRIVSVEPVKELREIGYSKGLAEHELISGDATNLAFSEGEFDLVCEFAMLHHVKHPNVVVKEMLRVAKKGVFISDSNNFGQGGPSARAFKQTVNALGLWKLVDLIKTRGRGYTISEGDGLGYSYSVFNDYKAIASQCDVHVMNTSGGGKNPYRDAPHVVLFGIKKG